MLLLVALTTAPMAIGAQAVESTRCYRFDRPYFTWLGVAMPTARDGADDSTSLVMLRAQPQPRYDAPTARALDLVAGHIDTLANHGRLSGNYWFPIGNDSLAIVWTDATWTPTLRMAVQSDSLVGELRPVPGQGQRAPEPALAKRFDCAKAASMGESCFGIQLLIVGAGTVGGVVMGWLMFTFGLGVFASDHGAVYKRERSRWVRGGAAIGTALALFEVLRRDCYELEHPPRREPRAAQPRPFPLPIPRRIPETAAP